MSAEYLEDLQSRSRRPWRFAAAVVVVAVAVVLGIYRVRSRADRKPAEPGWQGPATAERATPGAGSGAAGGGEGVDGTVLDLVAEANGLAKAGKPVEARERYLAALAKAGGKSPMRAEIEEQVGRIGMSLLLEPHPMPEKVDYVVQNGDSLARIGIQFGTTVELIQRSNNLYNPNVIKAGDRLRVCNGKFSISIDRSRNDLVVSLNDRFFKRYRVGTGKYERTPLGTFAIADKIAEPVWWRPDGKAIPFGDDDNILGTRWMSLRATGETPDVRGYGIHGTWERDSIGKSESAGCVRLLNEDVEELFVYVPVGTPVAIRD